MHYKSNFTLNYGIWWLYRMVKDKNKHIKEKYDVETGYLEDGLPYAHIGTKQNIIVFIDGISLKNVPPSGFMLREFSRTSKPFLENFTFCLIGRKPNSPEGYSFDKMAEDYAKAIRREFKGPVNVIGLSTGGQLAHYLAADHPDAVKKLVILSAAYRLSKEGVEIERRCVKYYMQGKYGKAFAELINMMYEDGWRRRVIKVIARIMGYLIIGHVDYPTDFKNEIQGDIEMNFKDRLGEIIAPTLIISGELDIGYSIEDVRETANGISNSKLITYKDYGHDLHRNNWKQVQNDILDFLKA